MMDAGTAGPDPALRAFVVARGLVPADATVRWTALTGGVSSDIWKVDAAGRTFCVKRALPRLKVQREWFAPVERNAHEWAWLEFAGARRTGCVPQPLAHDPAIGAFAMAYLDPAAYPVWKAGLMRGEADRGTAGRVGGLLAFLHAASTVDAQLPARFRTDQVFYAIRLEPYLIATGERHPTLAPALAALAQATLHTKRALVHGDVSPKNILVGSDSPVFLDAECAWFGDPAFDLAFCLNHLLLKCLVRPAAAAGFLDCFAALARSYLAGVTWEAPDALETRAAALLPGLCLARIDGKSPVEYVTAEEDRDKVRQVAIPFVRQPPVRLAEIAARWALAVGCRG